MSADGFMLRRKTDVTEQWDSGTQRACAMLMAVNQMNLLQCSLPKVTLLTMLMRLPYCLDGVYHYDLDSQSWSFIMPK